MLELLITVLWSVRKTKLFSDAKVCDWSAINWKRRLETHQILSSRRRLVDIVSGGESIDEQRICCDDGHPAVCRVRDGFKVKCVVEILTDNVLSAEIDRAQNTRDGQRESQQASRDSEYAFHD